jgi:hypothetical protein
MEQRKIDNDPGKVDAEVETPKGKRSFNDNKKAIAEKQKTQGVEVKRNGKWEEAHLRLANSQYEWMYKQQLLGKPYKKIAVVRELMQHLGRSKGSVEAMMMNISAAREKAGLGIVQGYKPLKNYNRGLDAIVSAATVMALAVVQWLQAA